jgi:hypothetical protein
MVLQKLLDNRISSGDRMQTLSSSVADPHPHGSASGISYVKIGADD